MYGREWQLVRGYQLCHQRALAGQGPSLPMADGRRNLLHGMKAPVLDQPGREFNSELSQLSLHVI